MITGMGADETPTHGMKLHMEMVEVGYCSDTNHEVKHRMKTLQHQTLANTLRTAGHTVHVAAITLGTTGTIPHAALTTFLDLGLSRNTALKLCDKLHKHAITTANSTIACRRRMERSQAVGD